MLRTRLLFGFGTNGAWGCGVFTEAIFAGGKPYAFSNQSSLLICQ